MFRPEVLQLVAGLFQPLFDTEPVLLLCFQLTGRAFLVLTMTGCFLVELFLQLGGLLEIHHV